MNDPGPQGLGPGSRLAREVVVDWDKKRLTIDGQDFPYFITEDGASVAHSGRNDLPRVTFTIYAGKVTVVNNGQPVEIERVLTEQQNAAFEQLVDRIG